MFLLTADTGHIEMHRTISNGLEDTPFDRDSDREDVHAWPQLRFLRTAYWMWHRDSSADIVTILWATSQTIVFLHGSQKDG
jgi:hypothetical protein